MAARSIAITLSPGSYNYRVTTSSLPLRLRITQGVHEAAPLSIEHGDNHVPRKPVSVYATVWGICRLLRAGSRVLEVPPGLTLQLGIVGVGLHGGCSHSVEVFVPLACGVQLRQAEEIVLLRAQRGRTVGNGARRPHITATDVVSGLRNKC